MLNRPTPARRMTNVQERVIREAAKYLRDAAELMAREDPELRRHRTRSRRSPSPSRLKLTLMSIVKLSDCQAIRLQPVSTLGV